MTNHREDPETGEFHVTTTHAAWGAGRPHLIVWSDGRRFEYDLVPDLVRIGSAKGGELVLPGIDPLHAEIEHDDRDEFVLTLHGEGEMNANPEAEGTHPGNRSETLRTGARFTAGPWTFVFSREEFADHGRPYGGRIGGEFSDQPPQPARPDYSKQRQREHPQSQGVEVQDD